MTLVVGIRCTDGVVIGSDSAMTFGSSLHSLTIEQIVRKKIFVIEDKLIVTGSGPIGYIQRFVDGVTKNWESKELRSDNVLDIGRTISKNIIADLTATQATQQQLSALVATPCKQNAELIEFYLQDLQPEVKDVNNWYVSIGSGQNVADPLLGFVRQVFWGNQLPNYQEGIFAATMVIELACKMVPLGVEGPVQMAILCRENSSKGQLHARELTKDELSEHVESVNSALKHFGNYRELIHGNDVPSSEPPIPPKI